MLLSIGKGANQSGEEKGSLCHVSEKASKGRKSDPEVSRLEILIAKQCRHVELIPEELLVASPDSDGPETPVSDLIEDVQILSPSQGSNRDL